MPKRPCLDCGTLTTNRSRCDTHQAAWQARQNQRRGSATQRGYGSQWARTASQAVQDHRAEYGDWCPGWGVLPHHATDLTGDHIVAKANGGSDNPDNVAVLCRACNSRKHAQP
ncbi:HNH endonuclease [Actinacidiphila alni]|uniref:HNH endonuclease n=1 Tax=Actinacidiphila alni TaxID=380248 RepID=UPI001FE7F738|nr:HNH endonuclease [Actinacidiphila alni]